MKAIQGNMVELSTVNWGDLPRFNSYCPLHPSISREGGMLPLLDVERVPHNRVLSGSASRGRKGLESPSKVLWRPSSGKKEKRVLSFRSQFSDSFRLEYSTREVPYLAGACSNLSSVPSLQPSLA